MPRRLRILTWHVHGNYLYNLTQVPHDFFLVTDPAGSPGRVGRVGALPWGDNVHEAPVEQIATMPFDLVLYQHAPAGTRTARAGSARRSSGCRASTWNTTRRSSIPPTPCTGCRTPARCWSIAPTSTR